MSSTRAVEMSIQAVSPLLGTGAGSAARARAGVSAAARLSSVNVVFFGAVRMVSPGGLFEFVIRFVWFIERLRRSHPQTRAPCVRMLGEARRQSADSVP